MTEQEKLERWVIPVYRHRRTFYGAQKYFQRARDLFYRMVEEEKPYSILDVGCGHGLDSRPLMERVGRYVGIDPIEENLELARRDNPDGDFRIGYMQDTGFGPGEFEWVWISTVWDIQSTVEVMRLGIEECLRVAQTRVYSADCTKRPRLMTERYMMIPMHYGLEIRRINYNPEKKKADYLWMIDKTGIRGMRDEDIHCRH